MLNTPYNRKIQNFLDEYVNCSPDNFYVNGMMKNEAVKEAVRLLIEETVFSSVKDMRLQALKDYNIFLPAWVFELVKGEEKMTIQEALEIIKDEMPYESGVINEALNMVEGAVGKQIPRKPDIWGDGVDDNGDLIYDSWACPCCHEEYELGYDEYEHCPNCGQAIDMSEVEE